MQSLLNEYSHEAKRNVDMATDFYDKVYNVDEDFLGPGLGLVTWLSTFIPVTTFCYLEPIPETLARSAYKLVKR
ncbi:MAG: hypothetical protein HYW24_02085 [Candidatus Aenigmarchaeota archaeon]|nr:hypothetical protein [Candidatus Aenigmarchaeota archaeon]